MKIYKLEYDKTKEELIACYQRGKNYYYAYMKKDSREAQDLLKKFEIDLEKVEVI